MGIPTLTSDEPAHDFVIETAALTRRFDDLVAVDHVDLGVRAEFDDFRGAMAALRILDLRFRLDRHFAIGAFFGFAHYSGPTPALGYYEGAELQWRNLFAHWDLSLDARIFDHVQRDKLLASDPQNGDPVEWYTMQAPALFLSRRF